jgi:hypothetical protein
MNSVAIRDFFMADKQSDVTIWTETLTTALFVGSGLVCAFDNITTATPSWYSFLAVKRLQRWCITQIHTSSYNYHWEQGLCNITFNKSCNWDFKCANHFYRMEIRLFKTDTAPLLNQYNSLFHQNNKPVPNSETSLLLVCDLHIVFIWVEHIGI